MTSTNVVDSPVEGAAQVEETEHGCQIRYRALITEDGRLGDGVWLSEFHAREAAAQFNKEGRVGDWNAPDYRLGKSDFEPALA